MRFIRLSIFGLYWILLTILLLSPHPAMIVGLKKVPNFPWGDLGIHFTAFTVLTLLAHGSRLSRHAAWNAFAVLTYAMITESLQAFVSPRTAELRDYVENALGVVMGSAIYWWLGRAMRKGGLKTEDLKEEHDYGRAGSKELPVA